MKSRMSFKPLLSLVAMALCGQITPLALAPPAAPPPPPPSNQTAPVQLPAEGWNVVRLAHGNVNDATVIAYIKNSGKIYSLGASEILYLKEQGLSDQVVTAMLDQRNNLAATA